MSDQKACVNDYIMLASVFCGWNHWFSHQLGHSQGELVRKVIKIMHLDIHGAMELFGKFQIVARFEQTYWGMEFKQRIKTGMEAIQRAKWSILELVRKLLYQYVQQQCSGHHLV